MSKLKNKLVHTLMLPVYWLGYLFPKKNDVWVFGAWKGEKYNDNPKYLFEYVNRHCPDVRAVWLTRNEKARQIVLAKGYRCHHPLSLAGLYYSLCSSINVFCVSVLKDTHVLWPQKININLWHGIPLKKIEFDNKISGSLSETPSTVRRIKDAVYPFLARRSPDTVVVASSMDEKKSLTTAFLIEPENIVVAGSPRLDTFSAQNDSKGQGCNVLYMPTHRGEGEMNVTDLLMRELDVIDTGLDGTDCTFYVKLHFYNQHEVRAQRSYRNIVFMTDEMIEQDIYSFLPNVDILITDYSSVYFDFLLANRPIIFAPFDYEDYLKKDRELYYDYEEVTPGPKCRNWEEVVQWIQAFSSDPQLYASERKAVKDRFHQFQDGRNCDRVVQTIRSLQAAKPVWNEAQKPG